MQFAASRITRIRNCDKHLGYIKAYGFQTAGSRGASTGKQISCVDKLTPYIDALATRFEVSPQNIRILKSPVDFHSSLIDKLLHANTRIFLSTLYIGVDESSLIGAIRNALSRNSKLKASILVDALRGTREHPATSTASLIAPLVKEFGDERVEFRIFHTPNLYGIWKRLLPSRFNEGSGLQHMKLYGIDDEIILSGANLSREYFKNRQDRYHVISDGQVTDYYSGLHKTTSSLSYRIRFAEQGGSLILAWPKTNACPEPWKDPAAFRHHASQILQPYLQASPTRACRSRRTYLYPLLQLGPLLTSGDSNEQRVLKRILSLVCDLPLVGCRWLFTAGYFNIQSDLRDSLAHAATCSEGTILTASPEANGFYGSSGLSGMLPLAYLQLTKNFLKFLRSYGLTVNVKVLEWKLGEVGTPRRWTYHAKGFWLIAPNDDMPFLTIIGSSNYTKRSRDLDLEANALIITGNQAYKVQLGNEISHLKGAAKLLQLENFAEPERKVPWGIRLLLLIARWKM